MTSIERRAERGTDRFWQQLIEEPCPGCGMRGVEGDGKRCGASHHGPVPFILCVNCTATPPDSEAGRALVSRITIALASKG